MEANSLPLRSTGAARNADVDHYGTAASSTAWCDLPKLRCAEVAQYGSIATSEHGRHPSAFLAERTVPDGVNTAMNAVETSAVEAACRGSARPAEWSWAVEITPCCLPAISAISASRRPRASSFRTAKQSRPDAGFSPLHCPI